MTKNHFYKKYYVEKAKKYWIFLRFYAKMEKAVMGCFHNRLNHDDTQEKPVC